ncbi:SpoIIE family protein phosphatase [bacterium]|nr:SpoIIE family protein phosphatase [bacterium]
MLLHLNDYSEIPLYQQISQQLVRRILSGDLLAGSKIMPRSRFARTYRVSVKTVNRAYQHLADLGLIELDADEYCVAPLPTERIHSLATDLAIQNVVLQKSNLEDCWPAGGSSSKFLDELEIAQSIQTDALPKKLPSDDQVDMAASCDELNGLGGDIYDYIPLPDARFGVAVADACGKGLPGAMLVSRVQALLRSELRQTRLISCAFETINRQVVDLTPRDKFVTLFYGVFDRASGEFEYASAGHNFPMVVCQNRETIRLDIGGPAFGVIPTATYKTGKVKLRPNDLLFLYTDGVTECMNERKIEYGERRLAELLLKNRHREADAVVAAVKKDLARFLGSSTTQDDQTMLVLKVKLVGVKNACTKISELETL